MSNDTPRTDAAAVDLQEVICTRVLKNGAREYIEHYVTIDFARELERDNARLREELAETKRDREEARDIHNSNMNRYAERAEQAEARALELDKANTGLAQEALTLRLVRWYTANCARLRSQGTRFAFSQAIHHQSTVLTITKFARHLGMN